MQNLYHIVEILFACADRLAAACTQVERFTPRLLAKALRAN